MIDVVVVIFVCGIVILRYVFCSEVYLNNDWVIVFFMSFLVCVVIMKFDGLWWVLINMVGRN